MKLLVMSDIHGNLSALEAVLAAAESYAPDSCVLVGDLIDYGMRSNETVERIKDLSLPIICNIYGNHEDAVMNGAYERFSSERGRACAKFTAGNLSRKTVRYIENNMCKEGFYEFTAGNKKCLAIHGRIGDCYWKSLCRSDDLSPYSKYDYVFSGHSHLPHFFEEYYKADAPEKRNKKKTVFINPGSVGQPRNHNNMAQFVILDIDSEEVIFKKTAYDISAEQSLYKGQVDDFYRERLKQGV